MYVSQFESEVINVKFKFLITILDNNKLKI